MDSLKDMKVEEIAKAHPETLPVFQRHQIDLCCGGRLALAEVARKHGIDLDLLVVELEKAIPAPA